MRTLVVLVGVITLSLGCKTDTSSKPVTTGSGSAGSATGSAGSATTSATGSNATPKSQTPLTLPKGDGTPPKKTDKAMDQAVVDRLAKLEFPGFEKSDRTTGKAFEMRLTTPRPILAVTITMMPCFDCLPMDVEKWKAKTDGLKMLLAEELRNLPDTVWELGKTDLNGAPVIFTYQFGYQTNKDENGPQGAFSNAYALYYNDGKNQVRVVAQYKDDWVTREDMTKIAPREDLEKLARAFLDAYTHAW